MKDEQIGRITRRVLRIGLISMLAVLITFFLPALLESLITLTSGSLNFWLKIETTPKGTAIPNYFALFIITVAATCITELAIFLNGN